LKWRSKIRLNTQRVKKIVIDRELVQWLPH